MTGVLGYARTFFTGGRYQPESLPSMHEELARFHTMLEELSRHIQSEAPLGEGVSAERLLQGPFSDAMTHVGQLALLRRLAGVPVPPENFVFAEIDPTRLGPDQAHPVKPDEVWPEAPADWVPPSQR